MAQADELMDALRQKVILKFYFHHPHTSLRNDSNHVTPNIAFTRLKSWQASSLRLSESRAVPR